MLDQYRLKTNNKMTRRNISAKCDTQNFVASLQQ